MSQNLLSTLALLCAGVSPLLAQETLIYGQDPVDKQTKVQVDRTASRGKPVIEVISAAASTAINPAAAVAQKPVIDALTQQGAVRRNIQTLTDAARKRLPKKHYPWKRDVVTTTFWIGQGASGYNSTMNKKSAWDGAWARQYGGEDDPKKRAAGGILPARFAATLNPFYIALPFNDVKYPKKAAQWVPWWDADFHKENRWLSQCKGRWVQVRGADGRTCYAQWEDVGPFRYDHVEYIFGKERPTTYNKAGLDISPAVKEFLGLTGLDICDWRFVEDYEVPPGPWLKYGEQAIIFAALEREAKRKKATKKK